MFLLPLICGALQEGAAAQITQEDVCQRAWGKGGEGRGERGGIALEKRERHGIYFGRGGEKLKLSLPT